MLKKFGLLVLSGASLFAMHNVELNINDKDLEVSVKMDMGQFVHTVEPESVYIGVKFLHPDKSYSNIDKKPINNLNYTDIENYYEFSFLMRRDIEKTGFSVGLGVKMNASNKFVSIPLGIELGYKIPLLNYIPMILNTSIYYAPQALAMRNATSFLEYRINYDIEIIKNAKVTMGYRILNTNYETDSNSPYFKKDIRYNSSPYIGFKFVF